MLHSKYPHKNSYEDPKTSAVFENLMLLPDNVFWHILKSSCFNNAKMRINSGRLISYDFWPHWDNTGTDNQSYVEPDLFISFEELDVSRVSGGNFTLPSLGTVLDSLPSHGSSYLTLLFIN